jgi:thiamine biosynthesis lipoprotein
MDRRDFIRPEQVGRAAGQVLGAVHELSEQEPAPQAATTALLRFSHRAMATDWELIFPFGTPSAIKLADAAFAQIDQLEDQLSVYRDHSEVSRLNVSAAEKAVTVESGLFKLLEEASQIGRETEGAFDVATGSLIRAWGYLRGPRRVPGSRELAACLNQVGMKHVKLDSKARSVRFHKEKLEINLGAIGKGYAIDRAVSHLRQEGKCRSALLHGGHSSVYAIGSEPGTDSGWPVEIGHPIDPSSSLGVLHLGDCAMGTSAATFQYLEHHGRKLGHILDPRTGWPARGVHGATVIAPTAARADALATAFFIQGPKKAAAYCRLHEEVGAIMLVEGCDNPMVIGRAVEMFRATERV